MKNIRSSIRISSVYLGTILGAGFASGQELLTYFAVYGINGMFGCLLSGMLFGFVLYIILNLIYKNNIDNYAEFSKFLYPKWIGNIIHSVITIFMFVIFSTMLAGSGALCSERFELNRLLGVLIMSIACYIVYIYGLKGIVFVNSILAPVLLCGSVIVGIYLWVFRSVDAFGYLTVSIGRVGHDWLYSAIIYVSYNIVTAIVVVSSLRNIMGDKRSIIYSAFISAIALGIIGLCLGSILLINYNSVIGIDIPLLAIVQRFHLVIQYIYIIVLISAMFTTAIATGFSVIEYVKDKLLGGQNNTISKYVAPLVLIIVGIFMSDIGFSNFIKNIYPIFGYIGIFQISVMILHYFLGVFKSN